MSRGPGTAIVRSVMLAYCWATSLYAFIASSPFAYLQFIKPRVFHWLGTFSDWHAAASCAWLVLLGVLLWPSRHGARATPARGLFAVCGGLVLAEVVWRVVPSLQDGSRSIVVGVAALVPILGLGLLDHAEGWTALQRVGAGSEPERDRQDGRLFTAAMGTAMLVTAGYAVLASVSIGQAFEPDLLSAGLALGVGASVVGHLLVFSAAFVVLACASRVAGASAPRQYGVLLGIATLLFAGLFTRFVGSSVGLRGGAGWVAALAFGCSVAVSWGGIRLSSYASTGRTVRAGLDAFLTPPAAGEPGRGFVVPLVAVLPLAWGAAQVAGRIDWDFALLKSGVVAVWLLTFALVYRAAPARHVPSLLIAIVCGVPIAAHVAWHPEGLQAHALERYAVHNPSFLLTDSLLRESEESSRFDRFLRANTGLTDTTVQPAPIDLVSLLTPMQAPQKPLVFLLVVDSLRADYLSPYNPAVRFTPRLDAFAKENGVFSNAFTRYGGTGLSMPAIWAGSVLPHQQYVLPFGAMNTLEKVLDVNGYRRLQSHDHITEELWTRTDRDLLLDEGRAEMDFDFCATVDEIGRTLQSGAASQAPLFAQTRSLNLHVAAVRNGFVPADKHYPAGFEPPYAYRVERIDACFGTFVDHLKQLGLYDRSLIVLTADHGELIGEDGRWGHSYHMFPQVIQVPLFVHLPAARGTMRTQMDGGAMALSTDITPTIYAALGYQLPEPGPLAGRPLAPSTPAASAVRRRGHAVLSASYGAVYAVVSANGRRLYIADAIQERDHAYERSSLADLRWAEVPVDDGTRMLGRLRIRRHIDEIGRTFGVDRPF